MLSMKADSSPTLDIKAEGEFSYGVDVESNVSRKVEYDSGENCEDMSIYARHSNAPTIQKVQRIAWALRYSVAYSLFR